MTGSPAGQWIGPLEPAVPPPGSRPAYWLRREFEFAESGTATLRCSARGLIEVFVNGTRIGDELLPGLTQYSARLPMREYDITANLRSGTNAVAILLADGWFRGQTGASRAADQWGVNTSARLTIDIAGATAVQTDAAWRCGRSHVLAADLIAGQSEDRRAFDPRIIHAGFDDRNWDPVVVAADPQAAQCSYDAPPVRRLEQLPPVSVSEPRPGVFVADFGQNINGWCRLSALGPAGTTVTLTHGEWLAPDGDVTTDHLRVDFPIFPEPLAAGQVDTVVSAGVAGDVFEPRLTTHGFRYVRIEGHPGPLTASDITAVVVHSDLRRTGWFQCNDERVNRLHDAAVWSLRGNLCEVPTDCPQRERSGWTGDWHIFSPTAAFLYDVEAFSRKWLADVRLDQRSDGAIANISPATRTEGFDGPLGSLHGSAGWGDAIVMVPWALYEAYGDPAPLAESWEAMERWLAFGATRSSEGRSEARIAARAEPAPHERLLWDTGFHWGEWLEPGGEPIDFPAFVRADKSEVATAYLHRSATVMSRIARVLDMPSTVVDHYTRLAEGTRHAWQSEFVRPDGSLAVQTQASHVRALAFGLAPAARRLAIADRLAELVIGADTAVGTGFLSTPMLLPVLADNGYLDLAYELLLQPNAPGWMYMIDRGATTVWELWDGVDVDGVPHASLNHYSKGAVVSFLHRYTAGLTPASPGYRTFRVAPRPGGGITHATCRFDSRNGPIAVEWRQHDGSFEISLDVPPGTTAEVTLPNGTTAIAAAGTHRWGRAER
jgi:alpha-L-rhamnosidase